MVKAQEWLDKCYPKSDRRNVIELDIRNNNLEGSLNLKKFDNLKKFCCRGNKFTNLDISGCAKLEELDCSFNSLTSLTLPNLREIRRFSCSDNYLKDIKILGCLSVDKLISLNIANNDFLKQNLSFFSQFINLKLLWIGNDNEKKLKEGIYNKFCGSLKPLEDLTRLKSLNISNTDIDGGLEYLFNGLKDIFCLTSKNSKSGIRNITKQLSSFIVDEDEGKYDFEEWVKSAEKEGQTNLTQSQTFFKQKEKNRSIDIEENKTNFTFCFFINKVTGLVCGKKKNKVTGLFACGREKIKQELEINSLKNSLEEKVWSNYHRTIDLDKNFVGKERLEGKIETIPK
jgi:Leucine-rich repeat (LRR) protein